MPSASSLQDARTAIDDTFEQLKTSLRRVNSDLHSHPETAYQEVFAHKTLTDYLESLGFSVTRHAYGLDTAFEATNSNDSNGNAGRLVIFCAEYDALPDIGHACGHNLIATSSLAAFIGAAAALQRAKVPGRLRLLGTPAEEGGGGKVKLIENGAFEPRGEIAAAIMAHPGGMAPLFVAKGVVGAVGGRTVASVKMRVEFHGRTAHAALEPWKGLNALDAAVAAYNNVAMMRQQIQPDERIHGVFEVGGTVPNVIPEYARMNWYIRAPTVESCEVLAERARACFEAGAAATGCTTSYINAPTYKDCRPNKALCAAYAENMASLGVKILTDPTMLAQASTDMGNVSHHVPGFHGGFFIPSEPTVAAHNPLFAECAGTNEAHARALDSARGMALLAFRLCTEDALAEAVMEEFVVQQEAGGLDAKLRKTSCEQQ